jgi:hypothetical protein
VHECEVCCAKVSELRRGRCWGCYARWVDARPVGWGARCATCGEQRRRVLRIVELLGRWRPLCFNCQGQLLTLKPMPATLDELVQMVSRERRRADRRDGQIDTRVFRQDRRVGERRTPRDQISPVDDDMILEISLEEVTAPTAAPDLPMDLPISLPHELTGGGGAPDELELDDLTQIRDLKVDLQTLENTGQKNRSDSIS